LYVDELVNNMPVFVQIVVNIFIMM